MFVVDSANKIWIIEDFASLKPRLFCAYSGSGLIIGAARGPDQNSKTSAMLFCCCVGNELVLIQENEFQAVQYPIQINQIIFAPQNDFVLLKGDNGEYLFCESSFSKVLLYLYYSDTDPNQIIWCGNDTALLLCEKKIVMLGDSESAMNWELNSYVAGCSEVMGQGFFQKKEFFLLELLKVMHYNLLYGIRKLQV